MDRRKPGIVANTTAALVEEIVSAGADKMHLEKRTNPVDVAAEVPPKSSTTRCVAMVPVDWITKLRKSTYRTPLS